MIKVAIVDDDAIVAMSMQTILSAASDMEVVALGYVKEALKIGAKGYILKQDFAGVIPAIRAVYSGQSVWGNEIISRIPDMIKDKDDAAYSVYGITDKEYEIIELVAQGFSNKEIAEKLYLGAGTVRNYISTVLEKLHLRDRTQLAVYYYKH